MAEQQVPDDIGSYHAYLIHQLEKKLPQRRKNPNRAARAAAHQEARRARLPGLKVKEWNVVQC